MTKETIESPIFGTVEKADDDKRKELEALINRFPVDAFQILGTKFNELGLMILIDAPRASLEENGES